MSGVKERLVEYLQYEGVNKSEFGRRIGVSSAFITSMRKSIQPDKILAIQKQFPNLNMNWLLTGEGEMLSTATTTTEVAREARPFRSHFKEERVTMVPLLNVDSVGGMHSQNDVSTYDEQYVMDMIPAKYARPGDVAIKETGDSMAPKIPSGAILLLRQVVDWHEYFGYGHVYVLVLRDGRRITKRVTKCDENPKEYVLCESINPEYPSEELPRKMIYAVWKVIGVQINEGY